ncbi:ribonuclease R [Coprobacter secundus]|uniref:Ribonuclease R n=1 Tax=Coprobacter secundus subsp. similis TaxID=2751153 RepID=A0A7G1HZY8_9BACT|nr:ribonuclease R [Coprobacter secundus]BCI64014.1 ribonuclease R [Coprobacter secundus subsp. similis]
MGKKDKNKSKIKRLKKEEIKQRIITFFSEEATRSHNYKQVSHVIGAKTEVQKQMVCEILESLKDDDYLIEIVPGKYKFNNRGTSSVEGIFERRSNGKNHVITEDEGDPIFIAERNSLRAMNGDKVKVLIYAKRKNHVLEGEITEIIEKAPQIFIGTLEIQKHFAFLLTDNKILANDIFIPKEKLKGAKNGDKAIVQITSWPERAKNPYGEVIDILGTSGENNTEMHAILAEFGLPYSYPQTVEKAANKIDDTIYPDEIKRREDFRSITTFTIDPKDAKDFDDALSVRHLKNGLWEVGVHIADVTYYVKPDSIIDREAEKRATSIYLVDRVIPMLPERLCNQVCSLRPNEEKLCYSVIFELNNKAEIQNSRIVRTIIKSDRRFTYEEAQDVIESGKGDYKDEILILNDLAQKLRTKRFSNGAINFDRHEVKFEIDETGKPISVYFKTSKEANKLIEEFMLLANRTVAEAIGKVPKGRKAKAFVYRVHDLPDPEKMNNLATFIRRFGYNLKTEGNKNDVSKSINNLLDNVQGKREENLIETVAIRTMAKAAYSTTNVGHYGLAFDYYTHFTSPIRRYPDMMVHRLLARYSEGGRSVNEKKLEEECKHSSEMELTAANAERASIKYKQVEFLSERLGEEYDGVISGVTEWGLYVEINENKCEGLVPIRDLEDDFYEFDEKNYCLMGRRTHKIYRLGDPIRIQVARANLEKKQLDFALIE